MIPLLFAGCGSLYDGSFLVETVITDPEDEYGYFVGDKTQAVAGLVTVGGGYAVVEVDLTEFMGTLSGYALDVSRDTTTRVESDGCEQVASSVQVISVQFTSFDTFEGEFSVDAEYDYSGCGVDDVSLGFGGSVAGARLFDTSQRDDVIDPLAE